MLAFIGGIVLFALCIGLSVALHEAGHMFTAKAFGMRVRRYFIGFGPKLWSFRRGETEYGLKAIPAGGFCDIAGMTALDEVTEEEKPRAMWRFAVWKRVVVMIAGVVTQFVLGFFVVYLMAVTTGVPNVLDKPYIGKVADCAQTARFAGHKDGKQEWRYLPCAPSAPAPAKQAGLREGDRIVSVAGKPTKTWSQAVLTIQAQRGSTPIVVNRDGRTLTLRMNVAEVTGVKQSANPKQAPSIGEIGAIGAGAESTFTYNPITAFSGAGEFTGVMFTNVWEGIKRLPEKVPALISAIGGGDRGADTPISVVGASIIGGDAVEQGSWVLFLYLLAALNFFMGAMNLLPLLPLDGGHVAIAVYERIRNWLRKLRGLAPGGPVDYTKLSGVTMVVVLIGGAFMLLTITADIVNPIRF
ncbi:M50 family metallopeptidase [Sciscionella marina]|uniref:M50 family metallopeptidase n=1 Tax=Sciscionella marina TaxID=508770 RepID=UPI00035F2815|nr:site-2 protease family protein [Sciscionella marina]